jgi:hypothetical protein
MNSSITTEARFSRVNCGAVQNWQLKPWIFHLFVPLVFRLHWLLRNPI